MIEVLHDVLDRQGRLELVSIRNLPVTSLVPPAADRQSPRGRPPTSAGQGRRRTCIPIELVIDGQYADIVEYLEALENCRIEVPLESLDL